MNTWTPYRTLSDSELIEKAHTEFDSLTGTDLERELIQRLENLMSWRFAVDFLEKHYGDVDADILVDVEEKLKRAEALEELGSIDRFIEVLKSYDITGVEELNNTLSQIPDLAKISEPN